MWILNLIPELGRSLSWEDPLEKGKATHSTILAWNFTKSWTWLSDFHFHFQKNWTVMCKRMKLNHCRISHTKIHSKWIKDLNIRPEIIKLLEGNVSSNHFYSGFSNSFLDVFSGKSNKRINKWDYIKLILFCSTYLIFYSIGRKIQNGFSTNAVFQLYQYTIVEFDRHFPAVNLTWCYVLLLTIPPFFSNPWILVRSIS